MRYYVLRDESTGMYVTRIHDNGSMQASADLPKDALKFQSISTLLAQLRSSPSTDPAFTLTIVRVEEKTVVEEVVEEVQ